MTLHQLALSTATTFAEVTVSQPFGDGCDVFKVMDKVFMLSFHLHGKAAINLKVTPDHGVMLRDIYTYIKVGWHMNKQHWISVYEDEECDTDLVNDLITNSYALVVSKLTKAEKSTLALTQSLN